MKRGYPDFFGQQTFESHGTLLYLPSDIANVAAGEKGTLFEITGKGRIYGGFLYSSHAAEFESGNFIITVDAEEVAYLSDYASWYNNLTDPSGNIIYLQNYYDFETTFVGYFGFSDRITFDFQFKVEFQNVSGAVIIVDGELIYAGVE